MRVALVGNLANVAYERCRALRTYTDIEADVFVNETELLTPTSEPDRLAERWVKMVLPSEYWWLPFGRRTFANYQLKRELKQYDLIESYCCQPPFVRELGVPYISFATGSDLGELALESTEAGNKAREIFNHARLVLHSPEQRHIDAVKSLGLKNTRPYLHIVDTELFQPILSPKHDNGLHVLQPCSQNWRQKANDKFLLGFNQFILSGGNADLLWIKWGEDANRTEELIATFEVRARIRSIDGPISRDELRRLYGRSDVVADGLTYGTGLISLEAMSCGVPVLAKGNREVQRQVYGDDPMPILECTTEHDIAKSLFDLTDRQYRLELAHRSRQWVVAHHSPKAVVQSIVQNYEDALN